MLNLDAHAVWTNAAFLLPIMAVPLLGPLESVVVVLASVRLALRSGRFHTTYSREHQGKDVAATLTYLAALLGIVASSWSLWALMLPVVVSPFHTRLVWSIDSHVAAPLYILAALVLLGLQVGLLGALVPALLVAAGGLAGYLQESARGPLHSLWHLFGGMAAASAIFALALHT